MLVLVLQELFMMSEGFLKLYSDFAEAVSGGGLSVCCGLV